MPYIKKEDRDNFNKLVELMSWYRIQTAGELNYLITELVHKFLNQRPVSYQYYNDAIGALEGCKLELYRRYIAEYEDSKIKENGDVP